MRARSSSHSHAALLAAMFAAGLVACSSSSSGGTTDGGTDTSGGAVDPQNCQAPGSKPNEKGMGGYCSPRGGECLNAGPGGVARICTADVPDTPAHAWFCTYPCNTDDDCGTGAYCATDAKGKGCVPTVCKSLQDAGTTDSSTDDSSSPDSASTDASGDSSRD